MTRRQRQDGYTILEVVISILLTATLVSAVFSVALTAQGGSNRTDRKMIATQAERALSMALKAYVTNDQTQTIINGPNAAARGAGSNSWHIHTPGVQTDSAGDVYALAAGTHVLTCVAAPANEAACFVPKALRDPPFNGTIQYVVSADASGASQVVVTVNYTEPSQ